MNQAKQQPYLTGTPIPPESVTFRSRQRRKSQEAKVEPQQPPTPKPDNAGKSGLRPASQQDLIELHKRFVTMFTTLNDGLSESAKKRAEQERAEMDAKIAGLESSLNSLEGMLRIELVPQIRSLIGEEIAHKSPVKRRLFRRVIGISLICGVCVFLGATYSEQVSELVSRIAIISSNLVESFVPIWGHFFETESV